MCVKGVEEVKGDANIIGEGREGIYQKRCVGWSWWRSKQRGSSERWGDKTREESGGGIL